jgi:hypothetical protein
LLADGRADFRLWHFSEVVRRLTISVHGAKAEVSIEHPKLR